MSSAPAAASLSSRVRRPDVKLDGEVDDPTFIACLGRVMPTGPSGSVLVYRDRATSLER